MEKSYIGKIQNAGTQIVKAPHLTKEPTKAKVKTGKDMGRGK